MKISNNNSLNFRKTNNLIYPILSLLIGLFLISCSSSDTFHNKKYYDLIVREQRNYVQIDTTRINEMAVDFVIEGSKLQQQNLFAESILAFQEAMKYDSSASIAFAMAKSYLLLGKYDNALNLVIQSLHKEPNFIPAMELLTELYLYKNSIKDAITVYLSVYNLEPTRQKKIRLARIYEYDNIDTAIKLYEELLDQNEDPNLLLKISELYNKKGDTTKLIQSYERLIQYSSKKPEAYDALIRAYLEKSDYDRAFQILDSAVENFSEEDINYFYNLTGNTILEDSNETVIKFIPGFLKKVENTYYFDWRMNMIAAYLADRIKDSSLTNKFFERALKSDSLPDIPLAVSFHYFRNKNHDKALSILNEFNPKFPENFGYPYYRGMIYQDLGEINIALEQYYLSLSYDTNNIEVLSQIGLLYDQIKKYDSCDYIYRRILILEPDNALINNNFAYSLAVRGENLDTALIMSQKSLEFESGNPSYLDTYGWIQYQLGEYELALEYILKAIEAGEENAEVLRHLGYIYLKIDKKNEAIEAWEKSLKYEPLNQEIKEQLEKLK